MEIDRNKAIQKWNMITNMLFPKGRLNDEMCVYCEHHSQLDSEVPCEICNEYCTFNSPPTINGIGPLNNFQHIEESLSTNNVLPAAIKLASKLTELNKLVKKNRFRYSDKPINTMMCCSISITNLYDLGMVKGMDIIASMESILIDRTARIINEQLKGCSSVEVYKFISRIYLDTQNTLKPPRLILLSDLKIIGNRLEKLKRICIQK